MTKHHMLAITLTPSMLAKVAALRQGSMSAKFLDIRSTKPGSASADGPAQLPQSLKTELHHEKARLLQPMLPPRGAKGRHYSRHAISKLFQVPYHMLRPHPEHSTTATKKSQRQVRTSLRRLQDISQKSLCEQAHLNLSQRCALLNQRNPAAGWTAASLR